MRTCREADPSAPAIDEVGTMVDEFRAMTDQELVNEWARLLIPVAGGVVRPGVGSQIHPTDVARLEAITSELERRGYIEHGGVFTSERPDAPDLRPDLA